MFQELSLTIRLLIIFGVAFGLILGIIKRKKAGKIIGWMIISPIIMMIVWTIIKQLWLSFTIWEQLLVIVLGIVAFCVWLFFVSGFGREIFAGLVAHSIYDWFQKRKRNRRRSEQYDKE